MRRTAGVQRLSLSTAAKVASNEPRNAVGEPLGANGTVMRVIVGIVMMVGFAACGDSSAATPDAGTGVVDANPPVEITVSGMVPDRGAAPGGTVVTVSGEGFRPDEMEIWVDDEGPVDVSSATATEIVFAMPPGDPGTTVDVTIDRAGTRTLVPGGFRYLAVIENEPADALGQNDDRETAQEIPFDVPFTAHIGAVGDIDVFLLEPPMDGVVAVSVDFQDSYNNVKLYSLDVRIYHEQTEPWYLVGTAMIGGSDAPLLIDYRRAVQHDNKPYLIRVDGIGAGLPWLGWDAVTPYTITVEFFPDTSLEAEQLDVEGVHYSPADTFKQAIPIAFDGGETGRAQIDTYAWYPQDFDWFTIATTKSGWLRMTMIWQGTDTDPEVAENLLNTALLTRADTWELVDSGPSAGDPPNASYRVSEWKDLPPTEELFLRVFPIVGSSNSVPYQIILEHEHGSVEAAEPGDATEGDVYTDVTDLGTLVEGTPTTYQSYIWHQQDNDFYKLHTPPGSAGSLCIEWDYSATFDAMGWFSMSTNPAGVSRYLYLYDQSWFDEGGISTGFLINSATNGPYQQIEWQAAPDATYYLLLRGVRGIDQVNPYTVRAVFVEGATVCP